MMTQSQTSTREQCSLRTVPVWLKSNGKNVKVNAILDDASNESFVNENVANLLGIQETFRTVQVHVFNNSVETFQSTPARIEIESVNGDFGKVIEVKKLVPVRSLELIKLKTEMKQKSNGLISYNVNFRNRHEMV